MSAYYTVDVTFTDQHRKMERYDIYAPSADVAAKRALVIVYDDVVEDCLIEARAYDPLAPHLPPVGYSRASAARKRRFGFTEDV